MALLNAFCTQKHVLGGDKEECLAQRYSNLPEEVRAGGRTVTGLMCSCGHSVFHTCTEGFGRALGKTTGTHGMLFLPQCHNISTDFQAAFAGE